MFLYLHLMSIKISTFFRGNYLQVQLAKKQAKLTFAIKFIFYKKYF